jgi:hypothetical protein
MTSDGPDRRTNMTTDKNTHASNFVIGVASISLLFLSCGASSAITINPTPTYYDYSDFLGALPAGAIGTVSLNPANVTYLSPPTAGSLIFTRFAAEAPTEFPGWTAVSAAALNGTLLIDEYDARDFVAEQWDPPLTVPRGGADMIATYTRVATDPGTADMRFIQVFTKNTGAAGALESHIDPFHNDDTLPWYWTDAEHASHSTATMMGFEDTPSSLVTAVPFHRSARFETYLATFDTTTKEAQIRDGWSWGYDIAVVNASVYDFGDAPDSYQTLLASDGPRYNEGEFQRLGGRWDGESDGQPTIRANGDDLSLLGGFPSPVDDEDGVYFGDSFVDVTINIERLGLNYYFLDAWWDVNMDGRFEHPTELFINEFLELAFGTYTFRYYLDFDPGLYYSRFRLTWIDDLYAVLGGVTRVTDITPFGEFLGADGLSHGEVEDYVPAPPTILLLLTGLALLLRRQLTFA